MDQAEDEGLVHSVVSACAACGELRRIRIGGIPSWATSGERIILAVKPVRQGSRTQVSMVGNLGQKPNSDTIIDAGAA